MLSALGNAKCYFWCCNFSSFISNLHGCVNKTLRIDKVWMCNKWSVFWMFVINGVYFGCILYADDIVLLSISLSVLQSLLNIFESFAEAMGIKYKCKMYVDKNREGYTVNMYVNLYSFVV